MFYTNLKEEQIAQPILTSSIFISLCKIVGNTKYKPSSEFHIFLCTVLRVCLLNHLYSLYPSSGSLPEDCRTEMRTDWLEVVAAAASKIFHRNARL